MHWLSVCSGLYEWNMVYKKSQARGHSLLVVDERVAAFAGDQPNGYVPFLLFTFSADPSLDVKT